MRCLYEVLGVEKDVEEGGLKRAYRLLALKWHPDKNQDNLAAAEERFKEIQNAYEILSDPHERAWYDGHRDSIIRSGERYQAGGSGYEGGQRPADEEDLYQYFTSAAFTGFGDGLRGFYGVYDALFQRLAKQEGEAHDGRADRRGKRAPGPFPRFGFSDAPWPEVAAFYAAWGGFGTVKDFAWADQYHTASAPNRKVRRAMEGENDKARRAAKREYSEAVRELVAFLRKRDRRVVAHQIEEARQREQRQAEDAARRQAERQERLARAAAYQEAAWVRGDAGCDADEEESEQDLADEEQLVWYCPACEKHFKSEPAYGNHQRSKKHLQQVELLRQVLEEEEAELADGAGAPASPGAGSGSGSEASTADEEGSSSSSVASSSVASSSAASSSAAPSSSGDSEDEEEGGGEELDEADMLARLVAAQQGQQQASSHSGGEEESEEESGASPSSSDGSEGEKEEEEGEAAMLQRMLASRQRPARRRQAASPPPQPDVVAAAEELAAVHVADGAGSSGSDDGGWGVKPGKQRSKRQGKQPQRQEQPAKQPSAKERRRQRQAGTVEQQAEGLRCGVCAAEFATRNQLFKHLKGSHYGA